MKANDLLANVRVASPCSARWAHMIGDQRSRFCAECQKHVYNLSELSAEEATALIQQKEGQLCARFYQRSDGTILTADCPVGSREIWTRVKRWVGAAAALLAVSLAVPPVVAAWSGPDPEQPPSKAKLAYDRALIRVKTWLGYPPPPPPIMGVICVLPTTAIPPVPPSSTVKVEMPPPPAAISVDENGGGQRP